MNEARMQYEHGDPVMGLAYLKKALLFAQELTEISILGWWGRTQTARYYARALKAGIAVDFVRQQIAQSQLPPDEQYLHLEQWPWPIKVYTLGRFAIVKGDQTLSMTDKVQKKPLELLQVLLALGGSEVTEAKIIDTLWPEAEGDAGYQSFIMALQRLRKLLGERDAIILKNALVSVNAKLVWVDVLAFERLMKLTEVSKQVGQLEQGRQYGEQARALYWGEFLRGSAASWVDSRRVQLRKTYEYELIPKPDSELPE